VAVNQAVDAAHYCARTATPARRNVAGFPMQEAGAWNFFVWSFALELLPPREFHRDQAPV